MPLRCDESSFPRLDQVTLLVTSDIPPARITPAACVGHAADEHAATTPAPQDSSTLLPSLGGVAGDVGILDYKSSTFQTGYAATMPMICRQSAYSAVSGGYSATPRGVAVAFQMDTPGGTQLLSRRCVF